MIRAVLIDDEENSRSLLKELLNKYCPTLELVGEAASADQGFEKITTLRPDLIFLDIQMPGSNGFSLLKRFNKVDFYVIFITGYDQYAIDAIKFGALDYLLKPITIPHLKEAVARATSAIEEKENQRVLLENLFSNEQLHLLSKKIPVHTGKSVKIISVSDICWMESESNYVKINVSDNEVYRISKTLKEFEECVSATDIFIRINKSVTINIGYLKEYSKGDPCLLTLRNGNVFEISRRKKKEVLDALRRKNI